MRMISVSSSSISAVGYDPSTMQMQIRFKQGRTYTFCRVPQNVFDSLLAAGSKGRYYDQHIRDRYQCIESLVNIDAPSRNSPRIADSKPSNLYQALLEVSEPLALSYAQVRADLEDTERTSWAGTAHEIRELVSTMLRLLAPDHEVTVQPWYKQEPKISGPTQKQRVRYVLQQQDAGSKRREVVEEVDIIEAKIASLVRATYSRASDAAHRMKGRTEAMRVFRYYEAFTYDLLNLD